MEPQPDGGSSSIPTTGYWASIAEDRSHPTLPRRKQPERRAPVGRPRSGCHLRASPWLAQAGRLAPGTFCAKAYTGAFWAPMEAVIALAFSLHLLIGTGSGTGTQIATALVARWPPVGSGSRYCLRC